jgi:hypothetical protein
MSVREFTFTNGLNDDNQRVATLDVSRITTQNIQKLIEAQSIKFEVTTVYMRWETTSVAKRAYGAKTTYKDNLISFKLENGVWLRKDLSKSRTI